MVRATARLLVAAVLSLGLVSTAVAAKSDAQMTVYITRTGECYHRASCSSLRKSKIKITLKEAKEQGYRACKNCDPPT